MTHAATARKVTVWTNPGSPLHCEMCDAFLQGGGFVLVDDALHEVLTMESPVDVARTCWRLREAFPAGAA